MSKLSRKNFNLLFRLLSITAILTAVCFSASLVLAEDEESERTVVVACSDYQYPNEDSYYLGDVGNSGGEILMSQVAGVMVDAGITDVDGFLCAGDYDFDLMQDPYYTAEGINSLMFAANTSGLTNPDTEFVFVQGNHDPQSTDGGTSPSGNNDPASGKYGVFVINERDYQWGWNGINEAATIEIAQELQEYCDNKIADHYTAPVFVISHLPLHFTMRTYIEGDGVHAGLIFDVLNDAAERGLNIVYLFGHNHSNGWDDYLGGANVFLEPGDLINISNGERDQYTIETLNFIYMNAGYMGYYKHQNTEYEAVYDPFYDIRDLTMSCFIITDDSLEIIRYNSDGTANLKERGIYNRYRYEDYFEPAYPVNEEIKTTYFMYIDTNLMSLRIEKIWNDDGDRDHYRPSAICIRLLDNGEPTEYQAEFSGEGNTWKYTFTNISISENYTVEEIGNSCN